jgi:hypothetical protein
LLSAVWQYVLVVATPSTVHLFALSFSDGTPEGTLDVRATDFNVATDGVIMKKVTQRIAQQSGSNRELGRVSGRLLSLHRM